MRSPCAGASVSSIRAGRAGQWWRVAMGESVTVSGGLIAESLRVGSVLDGVRMTVTRVSRADVGNVDVGQPRTWTFIDFEIADDDVPLLAAALERTLNREGGWYCDFRTDVETFVVFSGRTFRYPRGDQRGRAAAADYARSVDVPEEQL